MPVIDVLKAKQGDLSDFAFVGARGIDPTTWYRWKTGLRELTLEGCEILAKAFADDDEVLVAINEYLAERITAAASGQAKPKTGPLKNGKK